MHAGVQVAAGLDGSPASAKGHGPGSGWYDPLTLPTRGSNASVTIFTSSPVYAAASDNRAPFASRSSAINLGLGSSSSGALIALMKQLRCPGSVPGQPVRSLSGLSGSCPDELSGFGTHRGGGRCPGLSGSFFRVLMLHFGLAGYQPNAPASHANKPDIID